MLWLLVVAIAHLSCSLSGKGRGKKRKGACPVHPPLLVIQDPQTAVNRLQERVSSLLLRSRSPSPPTPTLSPSTIPTRHQAPLWHKSALRGGGPDSLLEFYTSELRDFIEPSIAPEVRHGRTQLTIFNTPKCTNGNAICCLYVYLEGKAKESWSNSCKETSSTVHTGKVSGSDHSTAAVDPVSSHAMFGYTRHPGPAGPYGAGRGRHDTHPVWMHHEPSYRWEFWILGQTDRRRSKFHYSHFFNVVPCFLDKDEAVNELPSSGFVPETNDKTASVSIQFPLNPVNAAFC